MSRRGRHSAGDWPPDDDPFVELLRDSLHGQVDGYHPAGDGLQRIQSRIARRQRWTTFRPALAAVALAGVIALVAIGAALVPGSGSQDTTLADDDSSVSATSVANSPGNSEADEPLLMMWPYPNAAQAAEHGATGSDLPDLSDPVATVQSFIDSMFPGSGLTAGVPEPHDRGVGVPIESSSGQVGQAELKSVPTDDGPVWGVVSVTNQPSGDHLVLMEVTTPDDGLVPVEGTLSADLGVVAASVNVALYSGGQSTPAAQSGAEIASDGQTWSTQLHVPTTVTAGFVLAWTEDAAGTPLAVAAVPIGSGESSSPPATESSQPPSSNPGGNSSGPGSSSPGGTSPGHPPAPGPPSNPGHGSTPPTSPSTPPTTPPTTQPTPPVDPTPPPSTDAPTPPPSSPPGETTPPPGGSNPQSDSEPPAFSPPTSEPSAS